MKPIVGSGSAKGWIPNIITVLVIIGLVWCMMGNLHAYDAAEATRTGGNAFSDMYLLGAPADTIMASLGVPVAYFTMQSDLLYLFIAPLLLTLVVLLGIFTEIGGGIFPNSQWIPKAMAVLFTAVLIPVGIFSQIIYVITTVGTVGIIVFGLGGFILLAMGWAKHKLFKPGVYLVGKGLDNIVKDTEKDIDNDINDLNTALGHVMHIRGALGPINASIIRNAADDAALKAGPLVALKSAAARLRQHNLAKFKNNEIGASVAQVKAVLNNDNPSAQDLRIASDAMAQICISMTQQLQKQLDAERRQKVKTLSDVKNEAIDNL